MCILLLSGRYVPSDFFNAEHVWNDSFPTHQPFKFQYGSEFHVFNKEQVQHGTFFEKLKNEVKLVKNHSIEQRLDIS